MMLSKLDFSLKGTATIPLKSRIFNLNDQLKVFSP